MAKPMTYPGAVTAHLVPKVRNQASFERMLSNVYFKGDLTTFSAMENLLLGTGNKPVYKDTFTQTLYEEFTSDAPLSLYSTMDSKDMIHVFVMRTGTKLYQISQATFHEVEDGLLR